MALGLKISIIVCAHNEARYLPACLHSVLALVDVWEAANRDDLFPVTSMKHYPYVATSDFHKPKHLYSWKTLVRCEKDWPAIRKALRSNVDVALTLYRDGSWAA